MSLTKKLHKFAEKLDEIQLRRMDDEEDKSGASLPVKVAAGAGLYYGAKQATRGAFNLRKRYGADQIEGVGNQIKATASGAAREIGDFTSSATKKIKAKLPSLRSTIPNAAKAMGRAALRKVGFEASITDRLNELKSKMDDGWVAADHIIAPNYVKRKNYEDLEKDDEFGYHPDKLRRNVKIAAGAGLVGAGVVGAKIDRAAQKHGVYKEGERILKTGKDAAGRVVEAGKKKAKSAVGYIAKKIGK